MNIDKLRDEFTEIISVSLYRVARAEKGYWPGPADIEEAKKLYKGTPPELIPRYMVELNIFKMEVDNTVWALMNVLLEDEHVPD